MTEHPKGPRSSSAPTEMAPPSHVDGQFPLRQRFSDELLAETRAVFGRRTGRILTDEDARQILENLVGFFDTLNHWDCQHRKPQSPPRK